MYKILFWQNKILCISYYIYCDMWLHLLLHIFTFVVAFIFICCCICVHLLLHLFAFILAYVYICCIIYLHLFVHMYTCVPTDVYMCYGICSNCAVVHFIYMYIYLSHIWLHKCTNIKESMCNGKDLCEYICTHM